MDDKQRSTVDQAMAEVAETFPPFLWRFYLNLTKQGFSEIQAFALTHGYLTSTILKKHD